MSEDENRRIIIVDDEADIVQGYTDFLAPAPRAAPKVSSRGMPQEVRQQAQQESYEILKAYNGEEALNLVRQEVQAGRRIAGGFFDVKMPGRFDGLQAIQEIWKIDPDLRCAVVTAYHDRSVDDIDQLFGSRFKDQWDYLNKPFTQAEILQKARQMVAAWNRKKNLEKAVERLKATQAQLIRSERLAAVGQVARAVGHEFGNLLQAIMGKADLAMLETDPGKIQEKLRLILSAAEKASNIVRSLQGFSKGSPERASVDLSKVLQDTLLLVGHELKKNSIQLNEKIFPCSPVLANGGELEQVLLNLIINAIHAMPQGGSLEVGCQDHGPTALAWVKDSGTGISSEILPKIFDYAFTTKAENGSGLGLAICKEIIEGHGGRISVETQMGKGTIFIIRLARLQK